ncbi:helix-turn-helix transcriptional regulator [Corynebacterium sp. S7]
MSDPLTIEDMIDKFPGTNRSTWAHHRYAGTGPAYTKVGRRVFYLEEDVLAWLKSNRRTRTDELPPAA